MRFVKSLIHAFAPLAGSVSGSISKFGPGLIGALSVSYGFWLAWHPLGLIAAGIFLLLIDRSVKS